jgi:hypothetical protein
MNPFVESVEPQDNYRLLLTFENGEKRIFDVKPYLSMRVFMPLRKTALFKTVRVVSGSIEWRGEIDLSYDTLYLESTPVRVKSKRTQTRRKKSTPLSAKQAKQTRTGVRAK